MARGWRKKTLSDREGRASLSYFQLIEVAVVAAFRKAGLSLKNIRTAREYVAKQFQCEFPFAQYRFKKDGKRLVMDLQQVDGEKGRGKIFVPTKEVNLLGKRYWAVLMNSTTKVMELSLNGT